MTDAQDQALFAIVLEIFQAGVKCQADTSIAAWPLLKPSIDGLNAFIYGQERTAVTNALELVWKEAEAKETCRPGLRSVVIEDGETHIISSSPERET